MHVFACSLRRACAGWHHARFSRSQFEASAHDKPAALKPQPTTLEAKLDDTRAAAELTTTPSIADKVRVWRELSTQWSDSARAPAISYCLLSPFLSLTSYQALVVPSSLLPDAHAYVEDTDADAKVRYQHARGDSDPGNSATATVAVAAPAAAAATTTTYCHTAAFAPDTAALARLPRTLAVAATMTDAVAADLHGCRCCCHCFF